jgi:hypothetical protein
LRLDLTTKTENKDSIRLIFIEKIEKNLQHHLEIVDLSQAKHGLFHLVAAA